MQGIAPPVVVPFDSDGAVDHDRLQSLVTAFEQAGVDFLVPCGSTGEAELLTGAERAAVIETVVETASVPVVAGTGHPGLRETLQSTERAATAGADAALVITPFYYPHDQATLEAYYHDVADAAPIPVYLYMVPKFTDVALDSRTVARLASHPNIAGVKDSRGTLEELVRTSRFIGADESFELFVGDAALLANALDTRAVGGILALANLVPEALVEVFDVHDDDPERARELNANLIEANRAIGRHGIPGLKWAMRERGFSAGYARTPHCSASEAAREEFGSLLDELGL